MKPEELKAMSAEVDTPAAIVQTQAAAEVQQQAAIPEAAVQ